MTTVRRSQRAKHIKVKWEQADSPRRSKKSKKKRQDSPEIAPALPTTRLVADAAPSAVRALLDQPLPTYTPPVQVEFEGFRVNWPERDPFALFLRFLGEASLLALVDATNARAASLMGPAQQNTRSWSPVSRGELLCWLGLLFYMTNSMGGSRQDQWTNSNGFMRRIMTQVRWEQIHRFLTCAI